MRRNSTSEQVIAAWRTPPVSHLVWLCASLFMLVACLPTSEDLASQSPLLAALEKKSGLIAYVGTDGNIYTINQGGGKRRAITTDAELTESADTNEERANLLPTWAPDSDRLAFVGVRSFESGSANTTIYTVAPDGSGRVKIFESDTFRPIYLLWAPDSESLGFLTTAPSGALLLQMASVSDRENQILDAGQPFYWTWAPDGDRLLIHEGGSDGGRISLLTLGQTVVEEVLELRPALFQSPSWTAGGETLVVAAVNEDGESELIATDRQGAIQRTLVGLGERRVSFVVSPDGRKAGFVASEPSSIQGILGRLGRLTVIDIEQTDEVGYADGEEVAAFFWSPDSEKIAYFIPESVSLSSETDEADEPSAVIVLRLFVFNVEDGTSERIGEFIPTSAFLDILSLFDQFHQSATIWSPDSKNLVVSGYAGSQIPQVMVVNASGSLEPRPIAEGSLAFWSWK